MVFSFYIWQPCLVFHFWRFYVFPLALLTSASGFLALDSRFLFSTVGSSWHRVYVFPLFAHVSCFPRLTAASSFPARFNKFLHACCRFVFSHPYHWLHYFCCPHWRTCLLRSRHLSCHATPLPLQPLKRKRSIVVTRQVTAF